MFRYLPQSGASPLWPVLFVWVLLNSCCGELKYANFSEINSNYSLPPARVCVIWNLTIAYGPLWHMKCQKATMNSKRNIP